MLSTIPNVKRAEISSPSPKASTNTRHSPITVEGETNRNLNDTKNDSLTSSYSIDGKDKTVSDERASMQEQMTSPLNGNDSSAKTISKIEISTNRENHKSIENNVHIDTTNAATNNSSSLSDMSRRKQRNPKPSFISSLEDNDYNKKSENMQILKKHYKEDAVASDASCNVTNEEKQHPGEQNTSSIRFKDGPRTEDIADNVNSTYSSSRSSSSPTPPPHDLSSMVKVEVHEGTSVVEPPNLEENHPSFNHSGTSRLANNSLPTLTPMPSQQRSLLMPNPPLIIPTPNLAAETEIMGRTGAPFGLPMHLSKMMMNQSSADLNLGLSKEDIAAKQNNMFHFGDVSVAHHPDTAPVPMVIPMVYLYPIPPSIDNAG